MERTFRFSIVSVEYLWVAGIGNHLTPGYANRDIPRKKRIRSRGPFLEWVLKSMWTSMWEEWGGGDPEGTLAIIPEEPS